MKKFLMLFFFTFSIFALSACGDDELQEGEQIEEIEEEDEIGDGEIDDE
ncbi:hypothetical protein SAMN05880501_106209 [Ureibacillus xyleni]|uniref:Uncharacterized protein n=1 Tax=Ureibacillus xyleni TaxID=614648 RepID=A0A285SSS9_9BACL|nr:hypothetical protein [Ureibacillus xyleni]SOC11554.1 hypothetical protein SAMN05880501_106209 [Ureibacillus xyleni]